MVARDAQRKADKQREDAEAAAAGAHAGAEGEHADWQVRLVACAAEHCKDSDQLLLVSAFATQTVLRSGHFTAVLLLLSPACITCLLPLGLHFSLF